MLKRTWGKVGSELKQVHLRNRLKRLNDRLEITEQEIINNMRIMSDFEFIHSLIGERENIKYKLNEIHKALYG